MTKITYEQIETQSNGRRGEVRISCPACGPKRARPSDADEKVVRIWLTNNLASYFCEHCKIRDTVFSEKGLSHG